MLLLVALGLPSLTNASDSEAKAELFTLFEDIATLKAGFVQRILDEDGEELQVLYGEMVARTPTQFRWEVMRPYSMTYLLNNLDLTVVDPDLHQVTYRSLESTEEVPIVALLLHRNQEVLDDFSVSKGRNNFELKPSNEMQLFKSITIYFDNRRLDAIDVRDSQDRLTEFTFLDVEENAELHDSRFEVEIADDMDVIGEVPNPDSLASDDSL